MIFSDDDIEDIRQRAAESERHAHRDWHGSPADWATIGVILILLGTGVSLGCLIARWLL